MLFLTRQIRARNKNKYKKRKIRKSTPGLMSRSHPMNIFIPRFSILCRRLQNAPQTCRPKCLRKAEMLKDTLKAYHERLFLLTSCCSGLRR